MASSYMNTCRFLIETPKVASRLVYAKRMSVTSRSVIELMYFYGLDMQTRCIYKTTEFPFRESCLFSSRDRWRQSDRWSVGNMLQNVDCMRFFFRSICILWFAWAIMITLFDEWRNWETAHSMQSGQSNIEPHFSDHCENNPMPSGSFCLLQPHYLKLLDKILY